MTRTPTPPRIGKHRACRSGTPPCSRLVGCLCSKGRAKITPQDSRSLDEPGQERRCREKIWPTAELGVNASQEVVRMRCDKTGDLKWEERRVHEQCRAEHAEGYQLSGDGEEVEASLLPALVLHGRVAEGKRKPLEEEDVSGEVDAETLGYELAMLPDPGRINLDRERECVCVPDVEM